MRWLSIGFFSIQPTDLARLAAVVFFAWWQARRRNSILARHGRAARDGRRAVGLILLQPNLSSAGLLGLTGFGRCVSCRRRLRHLAVPIGAGGVRRIRAVHHPYQMDVTTFLEILFSGEPRRRRLAARPVADRDRFGRLDRRGIGAGLQPITCSRRRTTDFIFSILAEETGFLGATILLVLLTLLAWRGMRAASRAQDDFTFLLAGGLTLQLGLYAFVNLAVATGIAADDGPAAAVRLVRRLGAGREHDGGGSALSHQPRTNRRGLLARQRWSSGALMKVRRSGGGTGGHVYPGIAVAEELRRRSPTSRSCSWQPPRTSARSSCRKPASRALRGHARPRVAAGGWPRSRERAWRVPGVVARRDRAPRRGARHRRLRQRPRRARGVVAAAPLLLQEQNSIPGSRIAGSRGWPTRCTSRSVEARSYFTRKDNLKVSGNRCAPTSSAPRRSPARIGLTAGRPTVFIFGGSRGAHRINEAALDAMRRLKGRVDVQFILQTGREDFDWAKGIVDAEQLPVKVVPFLQRIHQAYAAADLVVCRSGAMTLAEIAVCGTPAILVPYPHAAHDHQVVNASTVDRGAAAMILDRELSGERLAKEIRSSPTAGFPRRRTPVCSRVRTRPNASRRASSAGHSGTRRRRSRTIRRPRRATDVRAHAAHPLHRHRRLGHVGARRGADQHGLPGHGQRPQGERRHGAARPRRRSRVHRP
jgi:UDP-N-acetylglucosamine--N-acetylmuramyl-(pentapeptide) pyrophosphoryl-undecaprenol N-acetylglucosamine transferase